MALLFTKKKSDSKKQAPAAYQHWRSAEVPHGMGNFSFVHQTHTSAAGREGKTQNLAHPKQNKEGKRFSPCKVLSSC